MKVQDLQIGQWVQVLIEAVYEGESGKRSGLLRFSGGTGQSNLSVRLLVEGEVTRLRKDDLCRVRLRGYVRTVGKKGALMLTYYPTRGDNASLSAQHIRKVEVLT